MRTLSFKLAPIEEASDQERGDSTKFMPNLGAITEEAGYTGPARSALKRRNATPTWALLQAATKLKIFSVPKKVAVVAAITPSLPKHKTGSGLPSDAEADCRIDFGPGTFYKGDGLTYLVYLHPHGAGSFSWDSKEWDCVATFVPDNGWHFGSCDGNGRITLADGSVYVGHVRGDGASSPQIGLNMELRVPEPPAAQMHADGMGTMTYHNGDEYVGLWEGSKRQGTGRQVYKATGDVYEGDWHGDKLNGCGTYSDAAGGVLEAVWVEDEPRTGTKTWANGDEYVGYWTTGRLMQGLGKMKWARGTRPEGCATFDGHWVAGQPHGLGTMVWYNQDTFVGEFEAGQVSSCSTIPWGGDEGAHWLHLSSFVAWIVLDLKSIWCCRSRTAATAWLYTWTAGGTTASGTRTCGLAKAR